ATARGQLQSMIDHDADAEPEVRPFLTAMDRMNQVISVARDCADDDMACYSNKLGDSNNDVVRKAAYMIAWTAPAAQQAQARQILLNRVNHPDVLVRRSIMVALDSLSPTGC